MKPPYFLNVDLEIESKSSLVSLARELGDRVFVLFSGRIAGRNCLFVEVKEINLRQDSTINKLCALIEQLSPTGKRAWKAAHRREFDIGYEVRLGSDRANHFRIHPRTLVRVANLGAGLAVTLYRQEDWDCDSGSRKKGEINKA
jgi:hypothetical protein